MQVKEIEDTLTENISHIRILLSSAKSNCLTELLMVFHGFEYILEELYVIVMWITYKPAYNLHWPDERSQ